MLENSLLRSKGAVYSYHCGESMINLYGQTFNIPQSFNYRIIEVDENCIARPDLVSKILYNTDIYGDLLCKLNNIPNPFELNEGTYLVAPIIEDIEMFMIAPDRDTSANENIHDVENTTATTAGIPTPKKNNDKNRKANELTESDAPRYSVDLNNRMIVY